jgi:hypothetical protein
MQFDQFKQLPELFRNRAETDGEHDRVAGFVWRQAAELLEEALRVFLAERLSIPDAALAYGWNYEALRRKVSGNPALNAGTAGDPKVTHDTMLLLGRGRGPRTGASAEASSPASEATVDTEPQASVKAQLVQSPEEAAAAARLREIMNAASRSRRN